MTRIGKVIVAICLVCFVTCGAQASMMTYNGMGLYQHVTVHASGTLANNLTVNAGQNHIGWEGEQHIAYCVDINQYAGSSQATAVPVTSVPNGNLAAWLFDTYSQQADTSLEAAALQTALWEVLNETGSTFNVSSGYFSITGNSAVATKANSMLAGLDRTYVSAYPPMILQSSSKQDMLISNPNLNSPEPATMGLLILGATGLLARHRRRGTA